ncbi:uncharacterized protein LOC122511321 [Leptopilina heterotoma]|uniref:uncharacterized protein LOC122511321 n=1 Tax=Leptopilina heterotoma TaxID=63436 RepID=UPI001CAA1E2C|nr:uncharacterized protein LOC122511321 [Leptopilina heterotoma]
MKKGLIEKHPFPGNCKTLQAPPLNSEIKCSTGDLSLKKDSFQVITQNQLGSGISAMGKCLTELIIRSKNDPTLLPLIGDLADSGGLLTDLHYRMSMTRRSFITPGLSLIIKKIADECPVDTLLYGENFAEKLKLAKAAERSSKDIAKTVPGPPQKELQDEGGADQQIHSVQHAEEDSTVIEVSIIAGRLRLFAHNWSKLTSDKIIYQYVTGYEIPFVSEPWQTESPKESIISSQDESDYFSAINILLKKGAISECPPVKGQFLSTYFLAEKSNGEKRFILNLKKLNKFINPPHFKLEDRKTVARILFQDAFLATLDLTDAFLLIPVSKPFRKYLRFMFKGIIYEFNCVPFGLCTAPYAFTKIMKPVIENLRSRSFLSVVYLDDFLLIGKSKKQCEENIIATKQLLTSLGFIINFEKSDTKITTKIKYLGFIWDTNKMTLELTEKKKISILTKANKFYKLRKCKIRELAQFVGTLVASCPAVKYGTLYTKSLEREKFLSLAKENDNFDKYVSLSKSLQPDIKWWIDNISLSKNPITSQVFILEIFTDASLTGWGAVCNEEKIHGWWSLEDQKHHINFLELLAAFYGLKCFAKNLRSRDILLRIDNTTAISYINKMGGIQYPKLTCLCKDIWQWCEKRNLWIFASYIASHENVDADRESRSLPQETEWELAPWAFNKIENTFGPFKIDLFASTANKKCKKFISWKQDPNSYAIDAFTVNWNGFKFYAFPPFSVILRTLQKIITDKAEGGKPSSLEETYPGSRTIIREAFLAQGVPEASIPTTLQSLASSTIKQYNKPLRLWWSYCKTRNLSMFKASVSEAIDFLTSVSKSIKTYGTLNTYRSAVSLVLNHDLGNNPIVKRFCKGFSVEKPSRAKYEDIWDPDVVLRYLSDLGPNSELSLEQLSKKLVTLMALSTAQRLQTLSKINLENIKVCDDAIKIYIPDRLKTTRVGKNQPLPEGVDSLLLTYKKPYQPASSQTLSRWLKEIMSMSGIDVSTFAGYSAKHAAVSAAKRKGLSIENIRAAAGWSHKSNVFEDEIT